MNKVQRFFNFVVIFYNLTFHVNVFNGGVALNLKSSNSGHGNSDSSEGNSFYSESNEAVSLGSAEDYEDFQLRDILCPSNETDNLRYDLRAGKCGVLGERGHCGKNMLFTEDPKSFAYGFCECDFENSDRPLVYHFASNACYAVYEQAYCKYGQWLVLSKEANGPRCEINHCLDHSSKKPSERRSKLLFPSIWGNDENGLSVTGQTRETFPNMVPLNGNGHCVHLGEHSKHCDVGEKVLFLPNQIVPTCSTSETFWRTLSVIKNPCPPGSYYSIIGYCQPVWEF